MCKSEPCTGWHWCSVPVWKEDTQRKNPPKKRAKLKSGQQKRNHSRRQITSHPFRPFEGTGEEFASANPRPHSASKPWSYRLRNIIKQFKLDILMQAINTRVSQGENPIRATPSSCSPPPTHGPLSLVSLLSICRLITIKVFFTPCQWTAKRDPFIPQLSGTGAPASRASYQLLQRNCEEAAPEKRHSPENRKSVKADGGILYNSIWII